VSVDPAAVQRYLDGPIRLPRTASRDGRPRTDGGALRPTPVCARDPLTAERVVPGFTDRYSRPPRRDPAALPSFLLVASFVTPARHRAFRYWVRRQPVEHTPRDRRTCPAAPTADETLASSLPRMIAFREAY